MPRPRDRQSATGLLPRMEARTRKDGQITYRFHPLLADGTRGKPINLGTDKALAIRQVLDMASRASDQGTCFYPLDMTCQVCYNAFTTQRLRS